LSPIDNISCKSGTATPAATAAQKLWSYCFSNDWSGYDPYDALNSRLVEHFAFLQGRFPAILLTQALKRSPVNVRPLLAIPRTQNPKAIALFLSAALRAPRVVPESRQDLAEILVERLLSLRSSDSPYWCWGYSFPWRGRHMLVPRWTPNLVCTYFAGTALLDLYEKRRECRYLDIAVSAAEFVFNELYWSKGDSIAGFSYPLPSIRNQVHNANFLGAAFLCRIYRHTGRQKFLDAALRTARCSAAGQRANGSWPYGEASTQQWIDNFHTGYNLCALRSIGHDAGTDEFESCVNRGFAFYRSHFFREDGAAKYFHDRVYPIDIHCVAQSMITLLAFADLDPSNADQSQKVFEWALKHMWDERGFFCYRVLRLVRIRTSYMRWSQAWMVRALAELVAEPDAAAIAARSKKSREVVSAC
jgi:hypothetical protein